MLFVVRNPENCSAVRLVSQPQISQGIPWDIFDVIIPGPPSPITLPECSRSSYMRRT